MANPSSSEIIKSKPIGEGLSPFRNSFNSICKGLGLSSSLDAVHKIDNGGLQNLALDLISALQILPASRLLRSSSGSKNLFSDLSRLHLAVSSDDFDIERVIPLLNAVLGNESDDVIWNKVYAAAAEHVPPSISNKAALDTPLKSTSSSQQGSEQIHDEIDQRILQEINGCVYQNTRGFYEKYFEGRSWSPTVEKIIRAAKPQIVGGRWTEYPSPPSQKAFLDWFWTFQARFLQGTRGTYDTSHSAPLDGSDWKRQPDLFLTPSGTTKRNGKYNWADVQVIGELKQSEIPKEYKKELLWFCGHAREVFKSQPTRRFLHGFFIRGSMVELWVLNRSGLYSCEKFDIYINPQHFIRVIAGYMLINNNELGINTYIKEDKAGKHIMFKGEDKAKEEKLYLKSRPIAF